MVYSAVMEQFKNKVAFVTGAGVGIGYALCKAFAAAGANVILNDLDLQLAKRAAEQINADVGRDAVMAEPFDVADVQQLRLSINDALLRFGRLDIAIANAGLTNYGSFLDYTPQAFDRLLAVNLRGSYFTAQAAARAMIERKIAGRILLMSSVTGTRAFLNLSAYGTTKAGIKHMTKALALELGSSGITVNAIVPGAIVTERTLTDDPNYEANWAEVTPTGRVGYVDDVVSTALFLASDEARHITGQSLHVDGGWTLASTLPDEHPEQPDAGSKLK